jgi:plasmid replication initiation protein
MSLLFLKMFQSASTTNLYFAKITAINNDDTKVWRLSVEKFPHSSNNSDDEHVTQFDVTLLISERSDATAISGE